MHLDSGMWLQDVAANVDRLSLEQLLRLHELFVCPLCPATKRRLVQAATAPPLPAADALELSVAA